MRLRYPLSDQRRYHGQRSTANQGALSDHQGALTLALNLTLTLALTLHPNLSGHKGALTLALTLTKAPSPRRASAASSASRCS